MTVHLFKNGTGMITGGHTRACTTVPSINGRLTLGDTVINIDGVTEITEQIQSGMKTAQFVSDDGTIYSIGVVSVRQGSVMSLNAESDTVINMLHSVDGLVDKYGELSEKYEALKAKIEYDSIGFITEGGENEI